MNYIFGAECDDLAIFIFTFFESQWLKPPKITSFSHFSYFNFTRRKKIVIDPPLPCPPTIRVFYKFLVVGAMFEQGQK